MKLSSLPSVLIQDVAAALDIHHFMLSPWRNGISPGVLELRELRQLRDENAKLMRAVAELPLDRHILPEVSKKKSEAVATSRDCMLDSRTIPSQ